jgi:hypothetical protein
MFQVTSPTPGNLLTCLLQTPPIELLGLALLRQSRPAPGAWFPTQIPPEQVKQATLEFIVYGNHCLEMAQHLAALPPVPLALSCPEYGL